MAIKDSLFNEITSRAEGWIDRQTERGEDQYIEEQYVSHLTY